MDVNDLLCSNTLNYLAIGMNIIPGLSLQETADKIQQAQSGSLRAFTYDKLFIRHWGNWFDGQRSHPFIQPISYSNSSFSLLSSIPYDVLNGFLFFFFFFSKKTKKTGFKLKRNGCRCTNQTIWWH